MQINFTLSPCVDYFRSNFALIFGTKKNGNAREYEISTRENFTNGNGVEVFDTEKANGLFFFFSFFLGARQPVLWSNLKSASLVETRSTVSIEESRA